MPLDPAARNSMIWFSQHHLDGSDTDVLRGAFA
jgi:hypothetical protein